MNQSQDTALFLEEDGSNWLRRVIFYVRMCFLPIIVAGTITNVLCFVVLSKKEMKRLSTSVYLLALACADLGVMYFELFRVWFEWTNILDPEIYFTDIYCKLANFTNGVVRDFSNWLVAFLTLERLIMVVSPYKAKSFCTVKNARVATVTLFGVICVPHVHCIVFSTPTKRVWWVCWEDERNAAASIIAAAVELIVGYSVVIVVFLLNLILAFLVRNKNFTSGLNLRQVTGGRVAQDRRLTRTLGMIAVVFLVCETPRIILSFMCRFLERTQTRRILLNIFYVISGLNHASNFFIYTLSSPRFRLLFFETIKTQSTGSCSCCKRSSRDDTTVDFYGCSDEV